MTANDRNQHPLADGRSAGGDGPRSDEIERVFERISDGVFATDSDDRFTYLNSRAESMLGVEAAAIRGQKVWDVFPGAVGTVFEEHYREAVRTQEAVSFEAAYEPLDAWFEVRIHPDADGVSVYFRDVSERKERERDLEVYETAINAAADVVYQLDADGHFEMVNDALVEYTGYDRAELLGSHVSMVMDECDIATASEAIRETLAEGGDTTGKLSLSLYDAAGDSFEAESRVALLREGGEFRGTVGVTRDVTERNERERELERYEEVVSAIEDGVYALDDEGRFTLVNDAMTELTGYDVTDLTGEYVGIIKSEETIENAEDSLRAMLDGDAAETTFEFPLQRRDGGTIPCEDHMTVVYDDDGEFRGTAGVIRDTTAQVERQEKLSGLVERTRELMNARDEQEVAEITLAAASDTLGFDMSVVRLLDEETDQLEAVAEADPVREKMGERPTYAVGEGPVGTTFAEGEPRMFDDVRALDDDLDRGEARSGMYFPLGEYGVLSLGSAEPREFDGLDRQLARVLANSAATACTRVEREQELREERAFIEGLVDALPDVMYALNTEMEYIRWNDRLSEVTGHDDEQLGELPPLDLIAPDDRDAVASAIQAVFDEGEPRRVEGEMLTAEGEQIPYEFTGAPVRDVDGEVIGITGIGRDVSARKERERQLRRERDRFRALFSAIPEPVVYVRFEDGEPIVQTTNEAFEDVFGYEEETLVGESLNEYIVPDDVEREARAVDERAVEGAPVEREVRREAADGERDFLFSSVSLPETGEVPESIGVYVDITDQKETQRELERQNDRLEKFASTVSHDLRNPLKIARSNLEMASRECETPLLGDVADAHDRMNELIEDLLALARQGQTVDEPTQCSLDAVATDAWETVDAPGATLSVEHDGEITADEGRLQQLFENLFRNASEHAGDGVTVGTLPDGFYVADDGPGIPEDEREMVFEYGYTTSADGTGFGLAIVGEIADAHGWDVTIVESEDGGARFEFTDVTSTDGAGAASADGASGP